MENDEKMEGTRDETPLAESDFCERLRKFDSPFFTYKGMEGTLLGSFKKSAVLVPLFFKDKTLHILLTKRSTTVSSDKGEVAFPGGKKDDCDGNEVETALREAEEEIGLRPNTVRVISHLPPRVNIRRIAVFPVVAIIPNDFVPKPNPDEVQSVFSLPVSRFLLDDINHHQGLFSMGPKLLLTGMYHSFDDIQKGRIYRTWGLTANIIIELAVVVFGRLPDFNYDPNLAITVENPFAAQLHYLTKMNLIPGNKL